MRNIVVAIDPLTEEAAKVIAWSMDNFLRPDDNIHLAVVVLKDADLADAGCIVSDNVESLEHELYDKMQMALQKAMDQLKSKGLTQIEAHVLEAHSKQTCKCLVQFLNKQSTDCLIMGCRNLKGFKRYFMGSFSDYVQTHVDCPVLIVK
ncbi:adenine nucleotide alpha hydrolases-like protein [Hesseltinella vesiculosa]|uniref:Adenine nucleotide alpha hydrolases-like protein n=1 Tax=Hesseltinella vesiculosa TaxID=101127 RepID=A0A1X2GHU1_9FUNG|nr:adenine nucleotide alpha hydrolases-like protein [Hesseltinella vesiculosa]